MTDKVPIRRLSTGVPGLDAVLGGGLPEFSFNVVAGAPGAGKTTLVQQIMFTLARPDRPALYFTVLGEPAPQRIGRNYMVVKMQVRKLRGQSPIPGLHTSLITNRCIQVFPRLILDLPQTPPVRGEAKTKRQPPRVSAGVTGLDEMLGGGIP